METIFKVDAPAGETTTLYVNGQKTNVWYFLRHYQHFELNYYFHLKQKQRAETIKMLIDTGQIFTGNWLQWDASQYSRYQLKNLIILPADRRINPENIFLNCFGYEDYSHPLQQQAIYRDYEEKWDYIQWNKRIIDTKLSHQPAIQFFHYGYHLGFVI